MLSLYPILAGRTRPTHLSPAACQRRPQVLGSLYRIRVALIGLDEEHHSPVGGLRSLTIREVQD